MQKKMWVLGLALVSLCSGCHATQSASKPPVIKIMAPLMTGEMPTTKKPVITQLEKMTDTTLDFKWVPDNAYSDQLNLTLAANKVPNLIVFKNKDATFIKNAQAGAFWDLTDELKAYPHLAKADPRTLKNSSIDGHLYGIYRARDEMRASVTLRRDWLKRLGLKRPQTLPELTAVLKAFTEDDPDGNGQDDTYGMILNKWNGLGNGAPWEIVATWLGAPNGWGRDDEQQLQPAFMTPAYLEALRWFRSQIAAGRINPDFATSTDNLEQMFIDGRGGTFIQPAYTMADITRRTTPSQMSDCYTFTGNLRAAEDQPLRAWSTNGYSGVVAIPKASVKSKKQLHQILTFLDSTCERKAQVLIGNGIEGTNFKRDRGRYAEPINISQKKYRLINDQTTNLSQINTGVDRANQPYLVISKAMQPLAKRRYQTMATDAKAAVYNEAAPYLSKTYSQQGAKLDAIISTAQIAFMSGQIDEAGWQAAIQQWLKAGGQQVIAEYRAQDRAASK